MTLGEIYAIVWARERMHATNSGGLGVDDKSKMLEKLRAAKCQKE